MLSTSRNGGFSLRPKTFLQECAYAIGVLALSAVIELMFPDFFQDKPFLLTLPSLFIVSLSVRPSVAATAVIMATLVIWYFILPIENSFRFDNAYRAIHLLFFFFLSLSFVVYSARTERRSREQLAELNRTLELFVTFSPSRIALLDKDFRILIANRNWNHAFNPTGVSTNGKYYFDFFPPINEKWQNRYRKVLEGETIVPREEYISTGPDKGKWFEWELRPWRDTLGSVAGIVALSRNISERKWAEIHLAASEASYRQLASDLEKRVTERTRELQDREDKLQTLQRERELELVEELGHVIHSNEKLEHFAAIASHDLRAPARTTGLFLSLLKREFGDKLSPKAREYLDFSISESKKMQGIVEDLLEYSKVTHTPGQ